MPNSLKNVLKKEMIEGSAPCRLDLGGTLDIKTFYLPLQYLSPCTFNIAIGLRTRARISGYRAGMVKVSSKGFSSAEFPVGESPFDHPLGLMFAIAAYFRVDGVHIEIESASPPRSALGGSSAAAVALVGTFLKAFEKTGKKYAFSRRRIVRLAHAIEESVAGVPCGIQDQLAAAYGGVNAWYWPDGLNGRLFNKKPVVEKKVFADIEKRLLLSYCGIPHESKNINAMWVRQFLSGENRDKWVEIVECTKSFIKALAGFNFLEAAMHMNRETEIRRKMTPGVLDHMGEKLFEAALTCNCGARFTGAGGGGCVWAVGEISEIAWLKKLWAEILSERKEAALLDLKIESRGLLLM